ncbi:MAG: SDR family oxidoreductase [Chloroflexi bacterium]|nr:SDR family oxidoreductase [Chloroflexota bacterium]
MKHYIDGKVIIITGGASGFGFETARELLAMGAKVVITGRDQDRLTQAAQEFGSVNLLTVQADVTLTEHWQRLVQATLARFGRIDVLVNNAGAGIHIASLDEQSDADIAAALDVNLMGVIKGCREVLRAMKPNGRGHIVNIASVCASHAWPGWSVYSAAKAGLVLFTRCLHLEIVQWGGKATLVIPAGANTGFGRAAGFGDAPNPARPAAADFARTIVQAIDVPDNCVIEELTIWGTEQTKDLNPY